MQADLQERDRDPILSRHPKRHATRSPIHPCHLGAGAGPSAAAVWRALRASVRTPQGRARCRRASARLLQDCDVEGSRPPAAACGCIRPLTNSTAAGAGPYSSPFVFGQRGLRPKYERPCPLEHRVSIRSIRRGVSHHPRRKP